MATYSSVTELRPRPTVNEAEVIGVASGLFGAHPAYEPLSGGSNPDVFSVVGDLGHGVLKFYPAGSQQAELEAGNMARARNAGLPVPPVLGVDVVETVDGRRPWLAMKHAVGRPMGRLHLRAPEEALVLEGVGRLIADLHSSNQPDLVGFYRQDQTAGNNPTWRFRTWSDYVSYTGKRLSDDAEHLFVAGLTPTEIDSVLKNADEFRKMPPPRAVLTHADLRREHIYVGRDLNVATIIDWEAAQANGWERDFAKPLCANDEPMITAYATASGYLRAETDERIWYTRLTHMAGLIISNVKQKRVKAAHDRVGDVKQLLASRRI